MSAAKRVLLVGSSFSAAPLLFALKRRGYQVAVCGNLPTDPCHLFADESIYVDYSNADEWTRLLESEHFDFIVPSCNDQAYMAGAAAAKRFGLPGYDNFGVCEIMHTKGLFREAALKLGVPVPDFCRLAPHATISTQGVGFPLLVKPVDSFSGRGVTKVLNAQQLDLAVQRARTVSAVGEVVLEAFVTGQLHSHSAFIHDGKIVADFFVDEFCTVYPYQVDSSNHPSLLGEALRNEVREAVQRLITGLGLCDGLLHTQFIAQDDQFWIIECMRRAPGDLYGTLIERSTQVDYADYYIRGFLGLGFSDVMPPDVPRFMGRHTVCVAQPIVSFSFSAAIPGSDVEIVPLKCSGARLGPAPYDKLAIVFVPFESQQAMLQHTPLLASFIKHGALGGVA